MPPQTSAASPDGRDARGRDPGGAVCTADIVPAQAIEFLNRRAQAAAPQAKAGTVIRSDATAAQADHIRRSDVSWLKDDTPESRAIYELVFQFTQHANSQVFHLDLQSFAEPFQLATYRATDQGFYGWHVDIGAGRLANRKLSLIVPLTDPAEYEGGEFQVFYDHEPTAVPMPLGRIVAFPSYLLHRVTPVTRGVRRSLAIWVSGPPFR